MSQQATLIQGTSTKFESKGGNAELKIVTYNMHQGWNTNWEQVIDAFNPDIFLAQEAPPPPDSLLPQSRWFAVNGQKCGCAVYVKGGKYTDNLKKLESKMVTSLDMENFQGRLVGLELIDFPFPAQKGRRLRIFSLHAPPPKITKESYPITVKKMLKVIEENREDADLIIGGDFNFYSLGERHHSEMTNGKWPRYKRK